MQVIQKTKCEKEKEFQILNANPSISSVDGDIGVVKGEEIGTISLRHVKGEEKLHENRYSFSQGFMNINGQVYELRFREALRNEFPNSYRKITRCGSILENNKELYTLHEAFEETGRKLWIRNGIPYFLLKDKEENKEYKIFSITFDADYHFYQIMNEDNKVIAAIHKPYRDLAKDEYRLYAPNDKWMTVLYFLATYVDNFFRLYLIRGQPDYDLCDTNRYYGDHEAYEVSEDRLLQLWDEEFINTYVNLTK